MVFPLGLMLGTVLYQLTSIIKKKVFTEILYIIANIKNGPIHYKKNFNTVSN